MGNNSWRNWFGNTDGEEPNDGEKLDGNVNGSGNVGDSVDSADVFGDILAELKRTEDSIDELDDLLAQLDKLRVILNGGDVSTVAEGVPQEDGEDGEVTDIEFQIPTVRVKTEFFEAEAIEMYEMPYGQVLDLLSVSGPRQMFKMLDMFRLAVVDQDLLDDMELLTFNEISEVIGQWASKSTVRWMSINVSGDGEDEDSDS